jgi:hypothetical protein
VEDGFALILFYWRMASLSAPLRGSWAVSLCLMARVHDVELTVKLLGELQDVRLRTKFTWTKRCQSMTFQPV